MRTVGTILKEERVSKGFSLEQVEKATKIRLKYLVALEEEDYKKLPALPYVQGFIKNYSKFLGLRSTTMMAIFRREYIQKERARKASLEEPLTESRWLLTPNKVIVGLVIILVFGLLWYFYAQFRALHAPPPLRLESPLPDSIVNKDEIAVFGATDVDATVTINTEAVLVKEDGKFYKDVPLASGSNTFTVVATSRIGEKTTIIRRVTRAP